MLAETFRTDDAGPVPIVCLHGVGLGPASFDQLRALLDNSTTVHCPERPWNPAGTLSVEDQADAIAALIEAIGTQPATFVGVSGGATVGVALAVRHRGLLSGIVLHEPLLGIHAPALHQRVAAAAERVRDGTDDTVLAILRSIIGEHTSALPANVDRVRAEIPVFARFNPTLDDLRGLADSGLPVLTTVGGRSGPERHEAAAALQELAHAQVRIIEGAGNSVQLDAPKAFAAVINTR